MKRLNKNRTYAITCFKKRGVFDLLNKTYEDTCLKNYLYREKLTDIDIHYLRVKSHFVNPIKYLAYILKLKKNTINDLFRLAIAVTFKSTLVSKTLINNNFFHILIKNIFLIRNILITVNLYCKTVYFSRNYKIAYILIDHIAYGHGALALAARDYGISFYSNHFPYDIRFFKKPKFNLLTDLMYFKSQRQDYLNYGNKKYEVDYMPDLKNIPNLEKYKLDKYDYILYCHSFSDANNYYGWDGSFQNIIDWTIFTLNNLKDKKVLIKPHPNIFFNKFVKSHEIDFKLYDLIVNKYKNIKNFKFLDMPIDNFQFMSRLKKSAIVITHHGTMIGECATKGLKIISSKIHFLYDLEIVGVNIWRSKDEYLSLLRANTNNLISPNEFNTLHQYEFFKSTYGTYLNIESWRSCLSKLCSFERKFLELNPNEINKMLEKIVFNEPKKYETFIKKVSEREIVEF